MKLVLVLVAISLILGAFAESSPDHDSYIQSSEASLGKTDEAMAAAEERGTDDSSFLEDPYPAAVSNSFYVPPRPSFLERDYDALVERGDYDSLLEHPEDSSLVEHPEDSLVELGGEDSLLELSDDDLYFLAQWLMVKDVNTVAAPERAKKQQRQRFAWLFKTIRRMCGRFRRQMKKMKLAESKVVAPPEQNKPSDCGKNALAEKRARLRDAFLASSRKLAQSLKAGGAALKRGFKKTEKPAAAEVDDDSFLEWGWPSMSGMTNWVQKQKEAALEKLRRMTGATFGPDVCSGEGDVVKCCKKASIKLPLVGDKAADICVAGHFQGEGVLVKFTVDNNVIADKLVPVQQGTQECRTIPLIAGAYVQICGVIKVTQDETATTVSAILSIKGAAPSVGITLRELASTEIQKLRFERPPPPPPPSDPLPSPPGEGELPPPIQAKRE